MRFVEWRGRLSDDGAVGPSAARFPREAGKVNTGRAAPQVRARTGSRLVGCRLSGRARNALTSEPVLLVTLACRQVAGAPCALRAPGLRLPRSCSRAGPHGAWRGSLPDCRSCFAVLWIAAPAIPPRRMPVLPPRVSSSCSNAGDLLFWSSEQQTCLDYSDSTPCAALRRCASPIPI